MMHWSPLPAVRGGTFEIRRSDAVGPSHESTSLPVYRSRTTTHGRTMAGARGLWRPTGMTDADFGKPLVATAGRESWRARVGQSGSSAVVAGSCKKKNKPLPERLDHETHSTMKHKT